MGLPQMKSWLLVEFLKAVCYDRCCCLCILTTCCPYQNDQVVSTLQTTQSWHVREKTCLANARKTSISYLLGLPIMILPSTLTNVCIFKYLKSAIVVSVLGPI